MPTFEYVALGPDGRKANGVVSADSARAARRELRFRSLTPLSITEANEKQFGGRGATARMTASERVVVTRQLAMMISSGTQVEQALAAVSSQAEKPALRRMLAGMRDRVSEGYKFSDALDDHPKVFSGLYRSVVSAGEISGDLGVVLERLSDYLEKTHKTQRKVQAAMIYPTVLGAVAVLVVGLLMAFVVPRVVDQFSTFGQELPLLTRIVIGISEFLQNWGVLLLIALIVGFVGIRRLLARTDIKRRVDAMLLKLPVVGKLTRTVNGARFARTFAMLVGSGTPVVESLAAARGSLNNLIFVEAVDDVIVAVREGAAPAAALARTGVFPPMLTHLTASGAASDNLADLMSKGAGYLEDEFESASALALGLLEPLVILVLGGMVALIVLSIMLPIMQLNNLAFS